MQGKIKTSEMKVSWYEYVMCMSEKLIAWLVN